VRLEPALLPDPTDGRGTDADPPGEALAAPVGGGIVGRRERRGEDPLADLAAVRPRSARVPRVGEANEAVLLEPPSPQQDGRDRHPELVGDLDMGGTLGRPQDDPGAHCGALLGRARPRHRAEGFSFGLTDSQRRSRISSHAPDSTPTRFKNQVHCGVRH